MELKYIRQQAVLCLLIAWFVMFTSPVMAASAPPLDVNVLYRVEWSGIVVGEMAIEAREKEDKYSARARLESLGIARVISGFRSVAESEGKLNTHGMAVNSDYHTSMMFRKRSKEIDVSTNKLGDVVAESVVPPDNRKKRPEVPGDLKTGVLDPLSIILTARKKIYEAVKKEGDREFTLPLYDGRRRATLTFKVHGKQEKLVNGKRTSTIHVTMRRILIAGYTGREKERAKNEEPVVEAYLSDDEHLLPLIVYGNAALGTAIAYAINTCDAFATCEARMQAVTEGAKAQ